MLKRDAGILFVSAFAVLLSLQGTGDIKARVEWFEALDVSTYANEHFPEDHERLPRPIIADLDGDGTNEVVVATREPSIRILSVPRPVSDAPTDPMIPRLRRQASLMGSVRVAKGRRPVALATGFIDRVRPGVRRKRVVVVLTESFTVLCFDHRLRLLWETTLNHMEESLGLGHLVPNEVRSR